LTITKFKNKLDSLDKLSEYHKEIKIKEIKSNIKDAYANRKIMDYIKKY